ncbi:LysR family transcriptional regulator [Aliiglaciecola sp. M165]|uniref:LysR family transcriptional regulator n=1 Tax=Aliiglaciecola sp. M165 TaxID=2593649 RepID=UPI00117FAB91|nr:LysR family transcriptional regulator [Aliiglaciecola sp. M165]TRY31299.1 LysR family transcriptional regulator [Aliiglaciecola sp. M165]
MNQLEEMRIFVTLVECKSASKAAEKLGLANSAVSRRMKDLESRLGVQLMQRTTRRMHITEDGETYFQRCKRILEDIEETESLISSSAQRLQGTIKIAAPLSFGIGHLSSALAAFMHQHEAIEIDLDMSDRRVDIIQEGFDLALRIGQLEDSSLRARKLSHIKHVVCCSPAFLRQYGPIDTPEKLMQVPTLCYSNIKQPDRWRYQTAKGEASDVQVSPRMRSSNGDSLREAAVAGLGIICEPTFICHTAIKRGLLVPVLTDYQWFDMDLYAIYPQTRHVSARVRTFIDFLSQRFGEDPYWDECMEIENPHKIPATIN